MTYKEFKAGKSYRLFLTGGSILLIIFVIVMGLIERWSIFLLPPLILAILYLFKTYKLNKKPLFLISENELKVFNPPKTIAAEKITAVKQEGKNKLELILKDELPVPLFLNELSKADRKDLKSYIERIISRKE